MRPNLMIFDLDGTLSVSSQFYREVYSATLTEIVQKERGQEGLKLLKFYREQCGGKGELALLALNIPFRKWADLLIGADLSLISVNESLVTQLRRVEVKKVIYSGSPVGMILRTLNKIGFQGL